MPKEPPDAGGGEEERPELARLPSGRHGLPSDFVARNHRERLIAGLLIAVAEKGYGGCTVADVTSAAGVSRRTFYKNFSSKEECFLAAFELALESMRHRVLAAIGGEEAAIGGEEDWAERVRLALAALLSFVAAEPELARLVFVEPQLAGGEIAARQREGLASFAPVLRGGRPPRPEGRPVPEHVDEAVLGGIASLLASRINAGETTDVEGLLPELLEFALTPYLGAARAGALAKQVR